MNKKIKELTMTEFRAYKAEKARNRYRKQQGQSIDTPSLPLAVRQRGENNAQAKLNKKIVTQARKMYADGNTITSIKNKLNLVIAYSTLHDAVKGKTWNREEA